jgi:hypothetical protein
LWNNLLPVKNLNLQNRHRSDALDANAPLQIAPGQILNIVKRKGSPEKFVKPNGGLFGKKEMILSQTASNSFSVRSQNFLEKGLHPKR